MSTLERILESLEKLKTKHIIERDYEKAAEVKVVIDKIKKRFNEVL
jgi:protein-arginine kinase activator protein McsA